MALEQSAPNRKLAASVRVIAALAQQQELRLPRATPCAVALCPGADQSARRFAGTPAKGPFAAEITRLPALLDRPRVVDQRLL
jgi:hypothetical protein